VLEGIVVMSRKEVIELADLPLDIQGSKAREALPRFRPGMTLAEMEREAIQQCLLQTGGSRQRTAKLLGISTRTLFRKIHDYGLEDPLQSDAPKAANTSST
jgi:DNA-binding NtrC family response regulator